MENRIDRDVAEVMRDEMVVKARILSQLGEDPKTIPEIAAALEYPANNVMYWVMTMWRYGSLEEVGKPNDEGYYKYRPAK